MSVMYKSVARVEPGVLGGGQSKYYATIVRERPIELRKFATEIANMSTLTTTDVFAVLESFIDRLYVHLEEGRIVKMGEFGSFSPSINSTGADIPERVNQSSIKRFKVNFRPSALLSERLANVKFEKVINGSIEPIE